MAKGVATVWLPVEEMDRAVAFYRDVMDLEVTQTGADWSEVDAGGVMLGLNAREGSGARADGGAVITLQPDGGLDDEVRRLRDAGVVFAGEPSDHAWGRIATFKDSEGNDLQLYSPPRS